MLSILFLNDGTGDEIEGNYKWKVMINKRVLAQGELKGHNRLTGWEGLVKYFASTIEENKMSKSVMRRKKAQKVIE